MKRNFLCLFFLVFIFSRAQHSYVPAYVLSERKAAEARMQFRPNSRTGNYDWVYQRLELHIDPRLDSVSGNTVVYFKFFLDDNRLVFDLNDALQVSGVLYHGQPAGYTQTSADELEITLPATVPAGILDSVSIIYAGNPVSSGFGSFVIDTHDGVPVLWTLSEPYGAKDWWPCKQDLIDKADSVDVILHYPDTINGEIMKGVSNGILVEETVQNGMKTSHWQHRYPIPAYLVAIAVTNYAHYTHQAGIYTPFPVDNYVYPEDSAYAVMQTPLVVNIMDFYEEKFGQYPYAREKYGHAQFGWGGGMEHTTITFLGGFSRMLMAHELAHQWFGDDVTCGSWSDIWLNEGFATYSEALTQQYFDGDTVFKWWRMYADGLIQRKPQGSVYVYGADTLNVSRVFSWELSYLKGAMVLHMLRVRTGDSLFFNILRTYRQQYSYDFAKTEDFKNVVEQVTGEDYTEFFNDWVYGKGYPSFQAEWAWVSGNTYQVDISETVSDTSVSFFETPLRLRLRSSAHSRIYDTVVFLQQNQQRFYITADTLYDTLELDPEYDIIRGQVEVLFTGSLEWDNKQVRIFPNPATEFFIFLIKNPADMEDMVLFDENGKIIRAHVPPNSLIDVSGWPKGVYWMAVYWKNGSRSSYKILVE